MQKKFWMQLAVLLVLDVTGIGLFIGSVDPDPSLTLALMLYVPVVLLLNWGLALVAFFLKRDWAGMFLLNSLLASVLMVYLFQKGVDRHLNREAEFWTFTNGDTVYDLSCSKTDSSFSMTRKWNPNFSEGVLYGTVRKNGTAYYLTASDSTHYLIKDDLLYGFRSSGNCFVLTPVTY